MRTLIIYPHGLGDCILAIPMLRGLKERGHYICFAMLERFKSSEMFDACPYIDELIWTKDAWNDFPDKSVEEGRTLIRIECERYAKQNNYTVISLMSHSRSGSKIIDCLNAVNLPHESLHTEIFIREEDRHAADELISQITDGMSFGFIHGHSPSLPPKDFPDDWARSWLASKDVSQVVEAGVDFDMWNLNINIQFEIMRRASMVCLIDSSFYHAAGALNKKIDMVYFNRGKSVYNRVKPLHKVEENVVFELPSIKGDLS